MDDYGCRAYNLPDLCPEKVKKEVLVTDLEADSKDKCGYAHYMLKEIMEEPVVLEKTLKPYIDDIDSLPDLTEYEEVHVVACGSAMYAGMIGKTLLEAVNTDLVCDAINTAMRELFLQIVYGRSQTAFSEGGLPVGAGLEDLGKGHTSQVGTIYSSSLKGPRYLNLAEGYIVELGLDKDDQIIGYKYVHLGKMMDSIKKGIDPMEAIEKASGKYGRFDEAVKKIDPRHE